MEQRDERHRDWPSDPIRMAQPVPDAGAVRRLHRPGGLAASRQRIFRGPTWNYLCLEAELPEAGSYRTTFVGETPVVVVRDADGEIYAFENRCAHRGALIALEKCGQPRLPVRLPRLELQPPGRPDRRRVREGRQGPGRHADVLLQGGTVRASCGSPSSAVWCSAASATTCRRIEEYLGQEICEAHRARAAQAGRR